MSRRAVAVLIVAIAATGCIGVEEPEPVVVEQDEPKGIYIPVAPLEELRANQMRLTGTLPANGPPRLIYMNRQGGTYTPGGNNSSTNSSSIPSSTSTIPPWSVSDSSWNAIMDCMQDMYAPYNILVTDEDPGSVPHVESVVAGHPSDLGFSGGVGGVSPFNCGIIERSIVFTFAELFSSAQTVCEVAAQETAHSYGLDHQMLCSDPMTYLSPCGPKSFQDENAQCGEFSPRSCSCGGSTQNSHQILLDRLGEHKDTTPPDDPTDPPDDPTDPPDDPTDPPDDPTDPPDDPTDPPDDPTDPPDDPMDPPDDPTTDPDDPTDPPDDPSEPDPTDPGSDPTDDGGSPDLIGGCSATGGAPTGGALGLMVCAFGLALLRRRRQ